MYTVTAGYVELELVVNPMWRPPLAHDWAPPPAGVLEAGHLPCPRIHSATPAGPPRVAGPCRTACTSPPGGGRYRPATTYGLRTGPVDGVFTIVHISDRVARYPQ